MALEMVVPSCGLPGHFDGSELLAGELWFLLIVLSVARY